MHTIAVHSVRAMKGLPVEPVGLWTIAQEQCTHFYPAGNEKYIARAEKALFDRPMSVPLEEWAHHKAQTSANWRILEIHDELFDTLEPFDASAAFDAAHAEYAEKAQKITEWAAFIRETDADYVDEAAAAPTTEASRAVIGQAWWIASELVRRHPELIVYEMHPGGGMYDVLAIGDPAVFAPNASSHGVRVMLNRAGSIQVHYGEHADVIGQWNDAIHSDNPHEMVKRLESHFPPLTGKAPASKPRTLAYRFISTALMMMANDRHRWDARLEFTDSSYSVGPNGYIDAFPDAVAALRDRRPIGIWGEPHSRFWALLRNGKAVAIVSDDGIVYLPSGEPVELAKAYHASDRQIITMTVKILKNWL